MDEIVWHEEWIYNPVVDTIRFEMGERHDPVHGAVVVIINDCTLVDILREVELPFAAREGKQSLAPHAR